MIRDRRRRISLVRERLDLVILTLLMIKAWSTKATTIIPLKTTAQALATSECSSQHSNKKRFPQLEQETKMQINRVAELQTPLQTALSIIAQKLITQFFIRVLMRIRLLHQQ